MDVDHVNTTSMAPNGLSIPALGGFINSFTTAVLIRYTPTQQKLSIPDFLLVKPDMKEAYNCCHEKSLSLYSNPS